MILLCGSSFHKEQHVNILNCSLCVKAHSQQLFFQDFYRVFFVVATFTIYKCKIWNIFICKCNNIVHWNDVAFILLFNFSVFMCSWKFLFRFYTIIISTLDFLTFWIDSILRFIKYESSSSQGLSHSYVFYLFKHVCLEFCFLYEIMFEIWCLEFEEYCQ